MPRSRANVQFSIWEGLKGVSPLSKLLYHRLLTEETMTQCGVGALLVDQFAEDVELPLDVIDECLKELESKRYAFVDREAHRFLVRTLVRNDGIANVPNVLWAACRAAKMVRSAKLRRVLAAELRKLPPKPPDKVTRRKNGSEGLYVYPDPHATADEIDPDPHEIPGDDPGGRGIPSTSHPDPMPMGSGSHADERANRDPIDIPWRSPGGGGGGGGKEGSCSGDGTFSVNAAALTERASKPSEDLEARFDEFWAAYPRKIQKQDATKAWREVRRKRVEPDRIIAGARRYARLKAGEDPKFVRHPASWLRAGGYDDGPEPARLGQASALPEDPAAAFDDLRRRAAAQEAARIAGLPCLIEPQPPSNHDHPRQWERARSVEWIDQHGPQIKEALVAAHDLRARKQGGG
jgi:hypothetical protein